jgi:hypothetical protein
MNQARTVTQSEGPSGVNQTSDDHSHDSNQSARQPTTREILRDEGLDREE